MNILKLDNIQKEIADLPPDAQQIIFDLVDILKKTLFPKSTESSTNNSKLLVRFHWLYGCRIRLIKKLQNLSKQ